MVTTPAEEKSVSAGALEDITKGSITLLLVMKLVTVKTPLTDLTMITFLLGIRLDGRWRMDLATCIGYRAGVDIENEDHKLHITGQTIATQTPLIYGEFDNEFVKINGD